MQIRSHNVQCTFNDHDSQVIQYLCIDPYCQIKNKGLCEICKYGDHLNHVYVKLNKLDDVLNNAYLEEKRINQEIQEKSCNRICQSIMYLQNHIKQLQQMLKDLKKEKKEESVLELLVETYVKNDKLNLEEYNVTRDLILDSIQLSFGQLEWKQSAFTNQYTKLQQFSNKLLHQTLGFVQNFEIFEKCGIKLNNNIQRIKELQNEFEHKFNELLNQQQEKSDHPQVELKPIELDFKKQLKKISTIDLSIKQNFIAIGGSDKFVLIIHCVTAEQLHELLISTTQVYSVKFSPNDKYLIAAGSKPFEIYSWVAEQLNQPPIIFRGHTNYIYRLAFSNDSKYFLSSSSDQKAILWNIDKKLQQQQYIGHTSNVYGCAISNDMNQIATIGGDGFIIVYHTNEAQIQQKWMAHQCEYGGSSVNYVNQSIISSGYDGKIKLWSTQTFLLEKEFHGHQKNWIWCIAFSNKYFASICNDYTIKLWSFEQNQAILTLKNENNGAPGSELSLKNNQFIIATSSESIKIWKLF